MAKANENQTQETQDVQETQEAQPQEAPKAKTAQNERVEIFVPKASEKGNNTLFIGINGKGYTLPRGKKSEVPPEVAAEFYRSQAAEERRDQEQDAMKQE